MSEGEMAIDPSPEEVLKTVVLIPAQREHYQLAWLSTVIINASASSIC